MSEFLAGDRVRVIDAPEGDEDVIGLIGTVKQLDLLSRLFGIEQVVELDDQPARFAQYGSPDNYFFNAELELV